jgi:hypothetical protein
VTTILKSPVRVYPDRMAVYFLNGDVCADIVSGTQEQQRAVLALVGQAQRMARILLDFYKNYEMGERPDAMMEQVLRDAGVLP